MIFRKKRLASRLKQQLTLQQRSKVSDSMGGYTHSWSDVAVLWAEIVPISGKESYAYNQLTGKGRARIRLRFRSDITLQMRLLDTDSGAIYDIKSIIDARQGRQEIELLADISTIDH